MSCEADFADLLISLYSASELRRHDRNNLPETVHDLPGGSASLTDIAHAIAESVHRRGLMNAAMWATLEETRRGRITDIRAVRAVCEGGGGTGTTLSATVTTPPTVTPPTFQGWFDDDQFSDLRQAHVDANLTRDDNFNALLASIDKSFSVALDVSGNPLARISKVLKRLNGVPNLTTGEIPMRKWLREAKVLAGSLPQALVFEQALTVFNATSAAPPPPAAVVTSDDQLAAIVHETTIGDEDLTVEVGYLDQGLRAARAVARVLVPRHFGGQPQVDKGVEVVAKGTAWLLTPTLLITNHHVIEARDRGILNEEGPASAEDLTLQAMKIRIEFDYFRDGAEIAPWSCSALILSDKALDFALLRVQPNVPGAPPRAPMHVRAAPLLRPPGPKLKQRVNVLQHPDGDPMRVGFRDNFVVTGTPTQLSYLTDTQGGSSGSPVLDDGWGVVALHRGYRSIPADKRPKLHGIEVRSENYGVPLVQILAFIKEKSSAVHAEIVAAQPELAD